MTTSPDELNAFLSGWKRALGEHPRSFRGQFWEGPAAYSELKRKGWLDRVRCEEKDPHGPSGLEHYIAQHAVSEVCAELRHYKHHRREVRNAIERERIIEDWFRRQATVFRRAARRSPSFCKQLTEYAKSLEGDIRVLKQNQARRWEGPLTISYWVHGNDSGPVGPKQERELDGYFQIRLARLFQSYLLYEEREERVSLRTIARLVVLFLVCADLADDVGEGVRLRHNRRGISVASVVQQLRRSGLK